MSMIYFLLNFFHIASAKTITKFHTILMKYTILKKQNCKNVSVKNDQTAPES